jgi:hypothetical protein
VPLAADFSSTCAIALKLNGKMTQQVNKRISVVRTKLAIFTTEMQ